MVNTLISGPSKSPYPRILMLVGANDTDGAEEETATGVEVGTGLVGRGLGRELIEGERLVDGMEVGSPLKMTVSTSILWGCLF